MEKQLNGQQHLRGDKVSCFANIKRAQMDCRLVISQGPESVNLRKGCNVGVSSAEYVVVIPRYHDVNSRIQEGNKDGNLSLKLQSHGKNHRKTKIPFPFPARDLQSLKTALHYRRRGWGNTSLIGRACV
jgi:hypothetical protein